MSDYPKAVEIHEEGPREGFQIEPKVIPSNEKIRFIEALAETGVSQIDCVALVNPKRVPGWADADEVAMHIKRRPGVRYTGLWLNTPGLERASKLPLDIVGVIRVTASETFCIKNTNRNIEQTFDEQRRWLGFYKDRRIALEWGYVMTAFGCNYEGEVEPKKIVKMVRNMLSLASEYGYSLPGVVLADTVGMGTPLTIQRVFGSIRDAWPHLRLGAHLHDTRGSGIANAVAALSLGVSEFDTTCGGLGGCPFAANKGAAGNICTEDFVYLCEEMGISTGIDIERLIECAHMAEEIVGHVLPSKVMKAGRKPISLAG
jgi:hydroxymethylglutaryl-CoA lyase